MSPGPRLSWVGLDGARLAVGGSASRARRHSADWGGAGTVSTPCVVDDSPGAPRPDGREVLATAPRRARGPPRRRVVIKARGSAATRDDVAELERRGVASPGGLRPLARRGGPRTGCLRHGDQGQEHHHGHRRPPSRELRRLDGARGEHRPAAVGPRRSMPDPTRWVIETSSFQATDVASSPRSWS